MRCGGAENETRRRGDEVENCDTSKDDFGIDTWSLKGRRGAIDQLRRRRK